MLPPLFSRNSHNGTQRVPAIISNATKHSYAITYITPGHPTYKALPPPKVNGKLQNYNASFQCPTREMYSSPPMLRAFTCRPLSVSHPTTTTCSQSLSLRVRLYYSRGIFCKPIFKKREIFAPHRKQPQSVPTF